MELLPTDVSRGTCSGARALPTATRTFGKLLDDSALLPGDLLLTRSIDCDNDWASRKIVEAQSQAYDKRDAEWTHAAVCMGDGEHVCEANFGIPGKQNGVMLRPLCDYADGQHALRLRRPNGLSDVQRVRIAVGALARFKQAYDFSYLAKLWWRAKRGEGLHDRNGRRVPIGSKAVVCSTLHADAFLYATDITIGGVRSICVPAQLSCSSLFNDLSVSWLSIES